ncbi:probable mediator of RNA polymerase II transcription subunit 26b [Zea mays]|nr:probable mediator of RNA polymerase II transcription subunit 26b [Zea mays]|eukprot:XP_020406359.1 probable mediator of RNA polymerase II transcription subunit 26b [Zea mays]
MMMSSENSSAAGAADDESRLEPWRELFRDRDIYDVISKAILVAATDSPQEFRRRRDGIVEQIYTAPTVPVPQGRAAGERSGRAALEVSDKGSKVASCTVVAPADEGNNSKKKGTAAAHHQHANGNGDSADTDAFGASGMDWLQSLAEEMDAETQQIDEVLRIKEILLNHHELSSDTLFDSLRRLQLMQLTADKIKSTEIGGAIAAMRKHKSHKIRMLVHKIVKDWKAIVDDWVAATKATMDSGSNKHMDTSDTVSTEDGGLATPPMDIGALYLVSHGTEIQNVSEFLHGMDDDDRITGKRRPSRNMSPPVTHKKTTQEQGSQAPRVRIKVRHSSTEHARWVLSKRSSVEKKSFEENHGTVTRISPVLEEGELPSGHVLLEKNGMPTQSSAGPEVGIWKRKRNAQLTEMDMDETKRKLRGAYQEAENSKQRRAIQVVELRDIARSRDNKHVIRCRNPSTKSMDLTNRTHTTNPS